MQYDFVNINKKSAVPLYQQVYQCIRKAVESGHLPNGSKLPSIRKLSEDLALSRTTVESAYQQLCVEGFIASKPQSGYYVHIDSPLVVKRNSIVNTSVVSGIKPKIRYDLSSDSIDSESADIRRWRSHIRDVLNKHSAIISYGEAQGEMALRQALSVYSYALRAVSCSAKHILIGAGTQALLYVLCGLIRSFGNTIAMEKGGFSKAEQVFTDSGFQVVYTDGLDIHTLEKNHIRIFFVNPSENLTTGQPMKMNQRYELLRWAEQTGSIIIEDDYNGELRYTSHPLPALQGMNSERVVYMGSFSKLLLPSVRIGYMVLPEILLNVYSRKADRYHQTASKIEQLALASYINAGHLDRQLRRLRKIYAEKSRILMESLKNAFGREASVILHENSLCITLTLPDNGTDMVRSALDREVKITHISGDNPNQYILRLGFAGIPANDIESAVAILRQIYFCS